LDEVDSRSLSLVCCNYIFWLVLRFIGGGGGGVIGSLDCDDDVRRNDLVVL